MNESEDFLELVVTGHIIACTMEVLGMSSVNDIPSSTVIDSPEEVWMMDDTERKSILYDIASQVVENYIDLSTRFAETKQCPSADGVHAYACETLSLGVAVFGIQGCHQRKRWRPYFSCLAVFSVAV